MHNPKGMSRDEVDAVLGKPDRGDGVHGYDYVYCLGPERGLISIDYEWLGLKFHKDVVVDAQIFRD